MAEKSYHHGNLREALIEAGLQLLQEKGADGFSLRACAMRAGVSHAAPAHHFGDMRALLSALAAVGFAQLKDALSGAAASSRDPVRAMQAAGLAYIGFARDNPALFRLMYDGERLDWQEDELAAQVAAVSAILDDIAAPASRRTGPAGPHTPQLMQSFLWSMMHGYAHLAQAGQLTENHSPEQMFRTVSALMLEE